MAALRLLVFACVLLGAQDAWAHDLRPGVLSLREVEPDRFALRMTPPRDGSATGLGLRPKLPEGCRAEIDGIVCMGGLRGELQLPALKSRRMKMLVHVEWLDGRRFEALLREGEHRVEITGGGRVFPSYLRLGVEHILGGIDHLLFVLLLGLLAVDWRRLLLAVTAFTAAHSLTLGAAVFGIVGISGPVVELLIAASILLLAREALSDSQTLSRRFPAAIAFAFGLIHGFGFAGALVELGLPESGRVLALFAFNLGVELGQIGVLLVGVPLLRALQRTRLARLAPYAAGLLAGVWAIQRFEGWISTLRL